MRNLRICTPSLFQLVRRQWTARGGGLVTKFLSKLTGVTARSAASRGNMEMKRVHEDEELFESLLICSYLVKHGADAFFDHLYSLNFKL